jgi:MFS transporter, MFS domain-containing protein family, molybdate-anion transporter
VLLCGIISSLFEGSMYIFVFMWTPALQQVATAGENGGDDADGLPFGLIFSTFMVCCMAGSSIFSIGIDYAKGESLGVLVFATAAVAMGTIALADNQPAKFVAMNLFECTVGMYWPIMGTLKGAIVPESKRAAIYNLYRIPLNFIVLFSLLTDLTPTQSFLLNCAMLSTATVLQLILMKLREKNGLTKTESSSTDTSSLHGSIGGADLEEEAQAMLKSSPERNKMDSTV